MRRCSGLGLAIVKHVARAHHARVTVESAPGKGSTFTIVLPPAEKDEMATSTKPRTKAKADATAAASAVE